MVQVPVVALLSAVAAAACSASDSKVVADTVPINDRIVGVAADLATLRARLDVAVEPCVTEQGFRYFPKTAQQHLQQLTELYSVRLLALSVEDAKARGYGKPESAAPSPDAVVYLNGLSQPETDAYLRVYSGDPQADTASFTTTSGSSITIPVGGCLARGAQQAFGTIENYVAAEATYYDLQDVVGAVNQRVEASREVVAALSKWASCMSDAGHTFANPSDAREAALAAQRPPGAAAEDAGTNEVAVDAESRDPVATTSTTAQNGTAAPTADREIAVADAVCQERADLPQTFRSVALREQPKVAADRDRLFLAWNELMSKVAVGGYSEVESDSKRLLDEIDPPTD